MTERASNIRKLALVGINQSIVSLAFPGLKLTAAQVLSAGR
jgi:hypothetical protein